VAELIARDISEDVARKLAAGINADVIREQIEILDFRLAGKQADKIDDPAAWLIAAIKKPHKRPKNFVSAAERKKQAEAKQAKARQESEERRQRLAADAIEKAKKKRDDAYWESLTPEQQAQLDAEIDAASDAATLEMENKGDVAIRRISRRLRRMEHIRRLLDSKESAEPASSKF